MDFLSVEMGMHGVCPRRCEGISQFELGSVALSVRASVSWVART